MRWLIVRRADSETQFGLLEFLIVAMTAFVFALQA